MTTAIAEYSATEAALADLAHRFKDVVFDVTTKQGLTDAKKARSEIKGYRTALEAKRVEIKAPALERCRLIDAEAKRITAELVALEQPIDDTIKAEERRKEAEEAARVSALQTRLDQIKNKPAQMVGQHSDYISGAIDGLREMVIDGTFAEFEEAARMARDAAVVTLQDMHRAAVAQEAEQACIQAERAELARLRAEQEQRQREEAARIAEDARKRAEEEAAARRVIEEEQRAARARIDEEERQARAAREAADREARIAREAEEARIKAERDRVEAERRALEDAQRKEREADEARQREAKRKEAERADAWGMLNLFVTRYAHLKEFAAVVKAIKAATLKREEATQA